MRRSNELGNLIRNFKILNLKILNLILKLGILIKEIKSTIAHRTVPVSGLKISTRLDYLCALLANKPSSGHIIFTLRNITECTRIQISS